MAKRIFIFTLSVLLCVSVLLLYSGSSAKFTSAEIINDVEDLQIVIDCGHGGEDGGAVSENGTIEKDINLKIGLALEQMFLQSGFRVKMIRRTDMAIYDDSASTLKSKKISDLQNRVEICNSTDSNIFISIHQNMFEESKYNGTQIFYSKQNPESKEIAEYMRVSVKELLQNNNERQCKKSDKNIYILNNAVVPAVLVECGFLSNTDEERLLNTEIYQNKIAYALYSGFMEYYNANYR